MPKSRNRKKTKKSYRPNTTKSKWDPSVYDINWTKNHFDKIVDGGIWAGDFGSVKKVSGNKYEVMTILEKETIRRIHICLGKSGYSKNLPERKAIIDYSTKLNAVIYKVPSSDLVLSSINMNMSFLEFNQRSGKTASSMLNENWVLQDTINERGQTFKFYKCDNGSFIELTHNNN